MASLPLLPDDVISEILSWVAVKPACRFRRVSRGWRTLMLISSPPFLDAHKRRVLLTVATSFSCRTTTALWLTDIQGNVVRVIDKVGLWRINYCFNGPVCICVTSQNVSFVDLATGNELSTSAGLNNEQLDTLSYDYSVGCSLPSRTYKAVCLATKDEPSKVLTLEDGRAKWRQVQPPPTPSQVTNGGPPVTVNGVMHFLYIHHGRNNTGGGPSTEKEGF